MAESDEYRKALLEMRNAVREFERVVDLLNAVAKASGQGDPAFPLVVRESDHELSAAIEQELAARVAVRRALERLDALRPPEQK